MNVVTPSKPAKTETMIFWNALGAEERPNGIRLKR